MNNLLVKVAARFKTVFFSFLFLTLILDFCIFFSGSSVLDTYPNTYHGMKWDGERQRHLEERIAAADARIAAWVGWAIPVWIVSNLSLVIATGVLLGVAAASAIMYASWAAILVGFRTILHFLVATVLFSDFPGLWLFGWSAFSFFLVVGTAAVTYRLRNRSWPYLRLLASPSTILDQYGNAIQPPKPSTAPVWIAAVGSIAGLAAAIKGILELTLKLLSK